MNLFKLQSIEKLILTTEEISQALNISKKSAQVTASRYSKNQLLIRLKRDFYALPFRLSQASEEELFKIANLIQTPSYISLNSALSYYNVTTQQTQNFVESISLKRSEERNAGDITFAFTKLKEQLYNGFTREGDFFIASPEKALVDGIYLSSMGRYNLDFFAIDFSKVDLDKVDNYLRNTNKAARNLWQSKTKNL